MGAWWCGYEVLGRGQKPLDACNTDSMLFLLVGCLGWFGVYNLISVLHNVSAGVMRKWSHAACYYVNECDSVPSACR